MSQLTTGEYLKRLLLTVLVVLIGLLLWRASGIFLLAFIGILLATFLRTLADFLSRHSSLSTSQSLAAVVFLLIVLLGGSGWLLVPRIASQTAQLTNEVPDAFNRLEARLIQSEWGQTLLTQIPFFDLSLIDEQAIPPDEQSEVNEEPTEDDETEASAGGSFSQADLVSSVTGSFFSLFSSVWTAVTNIIFLLFIGIFVAAESGSYRVGIVKLFPPQRRKRVGEIAERIVMTLQLWLLGRFISMTVITVLTVGGLWLLGIPFALTLGLLAGASGLIPIFGPFLTALPAILLAFVEGPALALYVTLLYVLVQQLESNIIMPVVDRRTVAVPPALTLLAVFVMGALFGFLGLLVATPLLAIVLVIVKMIYLKDELGESVTLPGDSAEASTTDANV